MKYLFAIVLMLALFLPAQKPACVVRYHRGNAVCWCKANRPGSTWKPAPMLACTLFQEVQPGDN